MKSKDQEAPMPSEAKAVSTNGIKTGAIGIFDALGFKGIWRRAEPDAIVKRLRGIERISNEVGARIPSMAKDPGIRLETVCLSDTVVLAAYSNNESVAEFLPAVACVAVGASLVINLGVAQGFGTNTALAYRGCISYGSFVIDSNYIIGEAVDEAASLMDFAEGAFIWTCPSAHTKGGFPQFLLPYSVPLKGGKYLHSECVDPFRMAKDEKARRELKKRILATFASRAKPDIDTLIKHQNTEVFLSNAMKKTKSKPNKPQT